MLRASVGRKIVMGATGLFLCLFLIVHLLGNLLLFKPDGGQAFNQYGEFMSHNEIIRILEIGLLLGFLFHILDGAVLSRERRGKRPIPYAVSSGSANSSWTSRNMGFTGSIVFIFLLVHLNSFFIKSRFGLTDASLYELVRREFASPLYTLFYVLAMGILALHLHHGFKSMFQSLGLHHPKYTPLLEKASFYFALLIPAAFASIPIYFYLQGRL